MAELLSSDQVTVLGGPSKITVDLDFGPTGQRGSRWYVANGMPDEADLGGVDVKVFDMYINVDPENEEYLWMYQYRNENNVNSWQKILRVIPNLVSKSVLSDFVDGEAVIMLPLTSILTPDQIGSAEVGDFNIQHSMINQLPVITTIKSLEIVSSSGLQVLKITIGAIELESSSWSEIEGQKVVDLLISVV
jgi:hypothetical protein